MTRLGAYLGEAFAAIWRNRTRSILTMLGMIIGTASIIAVLGISKAASGGISGTLDSFGDQGIIVSVDPNQDDPARAYMQFRDLGRLTSLTSSTIDHLTPFLNANYVLRSNGTKYETTVSSQTDVATDALKTSEGRRFDHADIADAAHVVMLSHSVAQRFFHDQPAVGTVMRIGGSRFTIVGVYADIQSGLISSIGGSDFVEIPYTTFHQIKPGAMDFLQAFPRSGIAFHVARSSLLDALHAVYGSRAAYVVQDVAGTLITIDKTIWLIATALTAIGSVALVVAGIGIMNIMLVSVAERTREIGLRKSIGASRSDILTQFLLEAILLSLMGGGIGTILGLGTVLAAYGVVESYVGPAPIPYLLIVSAAVGFSTLVGCVFGTYPAWRASRLDPVVALRS